MDQLQCTARVQVLASVSGEPLSKTGLLVDAIRWEGLEPARHALILLAEPQIASESAPGD